MRFAETRKAWAASAATAATAWGTAVQDGTLSGLELATVGVAAAGAWVVAWATPNRPPRP